MVDKQKTKTPMDEKRANRSLMRRAMRLFSRCVLYASAALSVLILGTFLLLQTDPVRSKAKELIISAVSDAYGLQLAIGRISGDLLFSISLENVKLSLDQSRLLEAREISATYFAPLLLKKTLFVNEFQIQKGFLNLEKGVDGKWNMAGFIQEPRPSEPGTDFFSDFEIVVRRAALTDTDIHMVERTSHGAVIRRFNNIGLIAGFRIQSGAAVSADIYETRFTLDRPQFSLRNLNGEVAYDPSKQRLRFKRTRLRSEESDVSVEGSVDLIGAIPTIDVMADIKRLSLPEIGRLTSVKEFQEGVLIGRVSAKGPLDKLSHRLDLQLGRAAIRTEGTVIQADSGKLDLDIHGTLRELNLDLLSAFGLPGWVGILNAEFKVNGTNLLSPERRGELELSVSDSRFDPYAVDHGSLKLQIDGGRLNVASLDLKTPMGNAVFEGYLDGFLDPQRERIIQAKTKLSQLDLVQISQRKDLSGKLNLTLNTQASFPPQSTGFTSMTGKVKGEIEASTVFDVELQQGDLDMVWSAGRLDLKHFTLNTDSGRIALTGFAIPDQRTASVTVDLKLPDLEKISRIAVRFDPTFQTPKSISGNIEVAGRMDGWWDRPSFDGTLNAKRVRFNQVSAETLKVSGQWNGFPKSFKSKLELTGQNLNINNIRLSNLKTAATLAPDTIRVNLDATHHAGEKLALQGQIDRWQEAQKQITVDALRLTAKAASKTGKLGTHLSNQGPIRISLSQQSLDIRSFKVVSDRTTLSLEGKLHAEKDSALALSLSRFDLERIAWLMPEGNKLRGTLSADINVSGTGKKPALKADVRVKNGSGYDVDFTDLSIRLIYSLSKLSASATLNLRESQILELKGQASIGWTLLPFKLDLPGKGYDVSVKTTGLDLTRLPIPAIPDLKYDGKLDMSVRLVGDPALPELTGDVAVKKGSLKYQGHHISFSRLRVYMDYGKANAGVKIDLERNDRQLLTATVRSQVLISLWPFAFNPFDKAVEGVLKVQDLNLKELSFPSLAHLDYGGRMDISATIAGKPSLPVILGDLSIHNGHFAMKDGSKTAVPFSKLAAKLRYENSAVAADITLHRNTEQLLTVNGVSDVSLSLMPFRFKLGTDLDASMMTRGLHLSLLPLPKIPGVDIDGKIDVTVRVRGDWKAPQVTGNLGLKEASVSVKRPSLTYENVSADIRLIPGKIIIESVSIAGDKEGSLKCAGDILLSGLKATDFNVRLNGEDFFIPFHPAIRARVQPDILLSGSMDAPKLTGTITIPESRLNLDRFVEQGPADIQVKGRETDDRGKIQLTDTASRESTLLQPLSADLNVVIPKNAWLKGQGLDAEIGGTINIRKEPQKSFILLGPLKTIRGNYTFQGKLFKFRKGTVSFLGLEEPNPNLDFEAAARIRRVDIIIRIGGTARDIRLTLDSSPSMEQTDIVSYIMFGKPANSLNDRDSANVERAALNLTGQVAASELKRILGDDFFLDMITYEAGDDEKSRGAVAVGKYVTPDVFVKYRQGLSSDQPSEVEASYEVNKNISIQTNVGNEKTTGIDLFWEFDF